MATKREPLAVFKKHPNDRVKFEVHVRTPGSGFEIIRCGRGNRVIVAFASAQEVACDKAQLLAAAD